MVSIASINYNYRLIPTDAYRDCLLVKQIDIGLIEVLPA